MTASREASSFRDPSGFVFWHEGEVYRSVQPSYVEHYDALVQSGLYADLVKAGLLIPHEEVSPAALVGNASRVLKPRQVPFVSYPYEWCFGQLRDAALVTLDIQRRALEHGLTLKDSSAFNVQFVDGSPLLIDTLSFERYRDGAPWLAYRQFCEHFLAPLALMSHTDVRLAALLKQYLDGIPLDLTSALLPAASWLRFGILLHIHLHARSQKRFANTALRQSTLNRPVRRRTLFALVDSLQGAVRRLEYRAGRTAWGDYAPAESYDRVALEDKERLVGDFLARVAPTVVWDLGANVGTFSRVAAERGAHVVAADMDPAAVDRHYRAVRQRGETRILPLVIDLANPSPGLGWAEHERMSLLQRGPADLVLALALVHHLVISNNLPLRHVAQFLRAAGRHLIIEFVPKADPRVQHLLRSREDIFPEFTREGFESAFAESWQILAAGPIASSERRLYLMARR